MSVAGSTQYVDSSGTVLEFDESLSEEERRFYMKAYPTIEQVRDRKTHCTTCKIHIGTAPIQETFIRMHPVLRVTHCIKCHDFYNSGEFSKGEDGSELYCRWCGQGGEVYCCSNCPFVFCKSCIVKNLSKGVVADIEQNENWSCFSCAPKILWPLRAQHWALVNFIEKQKKEIKEKNLTDIDEKAALSLDRSSCCRLAKSKCGNMSDSVESIDSSNSRRSQGSNKPLKNFASLPKRQKTSNDEVVCTPDLMSMLEPDCQITVSPKQRSLPSPAASAPKVLSIQTGYGTLSSTPKANVPPPLVLRNTGIQMRALGASPVMRRPVVGPRSISPINGATTPVYHTINGFRIDLNSAAQQETFRLPNGKLIQVKRQGALHSVLTPTQSSTPTATSNNSWQQRTPTPINFNSRPVQITPAQPQSHYPNISIQQSAASSSTHVPNQSAQIIRYNNAMMTNTANASVNQNGSQIQMINGVPSAPIQVQQSPVTVRPVMVKHVFPDSPIGQARTQLQEEVFTAMDICQHLTSKVQTLTNSNAYKQARNYLEVKELYIHLSYLLTYAIGRFKNLQDKSLTDMRQLGFGADADSLENGQLPADKQASDDEDNEIEIVEPKTDTINLDSDNEDEVAKLPAVPANKPVADTTIKPTINLRKLLPLPRPTTQVLPTQTQSSQHVSVQSTPQPTAEPDFISVTQNFLASMFGIDTAEHEQGVIQSSQPANDIVQRKQPRKKTTSKPNPTLIKQKLLLERERLEEMARSDLKLKMKCLVTLKKAEEEFPLAKELLNTAKKRKKENSAEPQEMNCIVIDDLETMNVNSSETATTQLTTINLCQESDDAQTSAEIAAKVPVDKNLLENEIDNAKQNTIETKATSNNIANVEKTAEMSTLLETQQDTQNVNVDLLKETAELTQTAEETQQNATDTKENKAMAVEDDVDIIEYIEENILRNEKNDNEQKHEDLLKTESKAAEEIVATPNSEICENKAVEKIVSATNVVENENNLQNVVDTKMQVVADIVMPTDENCAAPPRTEVEVDVEKEIEELLQRKEKIEICATIEQSDCVQSTCVESNTKDVEVTSTTVESEPFIDSPDLFNHIIEVDPDSNV